MLKVAIAGNIASGKSTIQQILINKGYDVIDTDVIAKDLRESRTQEIIDAFSEFEITDDKGEISRHKLSSVVFKNPLLVERLANLMHPWIRDEILKYFEENSSKKVVFVGIPLLFEAKMENDYDKIIFVYTDDEIRLKRLIKRSGYTLEHAKDRIRSQMPQSEKVLKSDIIIDNNRTVEDLENQIPKMLATLGV